LVMARTGGHVPVAEERVGHVQEFDDLGPFLRPQHVRHASAVRSDDQDGALEKADGLLHAERTVEDHQLQICRRTKGGAALQHQYRKRRRTSSMRAREHAPVLASRARMALMMNLSFATSRDHDPSRDV
jgi:hypothetical protein